MYNRTSTKLQRPRVTNDSAAWVRCNNAYQAIIDPEVFAKARAIIQERDHRYTDEKLLQRLRDLYQQHGTLSDIIINEGLGMLSAATCASPFRSLQRAYERHRVTESKPLPSGIMFLLGSVGRVAIFGGTQSCRSDVETAKAAGRTAFGQTVAFLKKNTTCRAVLVERRIAWTGIGAIG